MSSTVSSAPTSTSTHVDASPNNDKRMLAVAVVLGIVSCLMLILIIVITLRFKRRSNRKSMAGPFHGTAILEHDHPAARIIPFGAPSNAPRFDHKPGADMRIAYRRPDGAWHFADSRTSFKPAGVSDLEATPTTASGSFFFPPTQPEYLSSKEREHRAQAFNNHSKDDFFDYDPITPPPPAYQRHSKQEV